jgi:PAS domain S-box-containing protein
MIRRLDWPRIAWHAAAMLLVVACLLVRTAIVSLLAPPGLVAGMLCDVVCAGVTVVALTSLWRARGPHAAASGLWRKIAMQAPIGLIEGDKDGVVTFANEAWCAIAGVTPDEVVGRPLPSLVHPEDLPVTTLAWERSVAERRQYHHQVRMRRADGRYRTVMASASPLFDEDGGFRGSISSVFDLTESIGIQSRQKVTESYIRGIMNHTSAVVYLKDLDGRFLMVNRRYEMLFPHMKDACIGTTSDRWFPPDVARRFAIDDDVVVRSGRAISVEEEVPLPGGTRHYLTVKFPVSDQDGRLIAVGGMATDITDLKITRNELERNERVLRRLIDVQEHEKQFLCHDFHDGPIQYAVAAHMLMQGLQRSLEAGPEAESLGVALSLVKQCIDEGRRVIRGIRPALLDDCGLVAAIEDLASSPGGQPAVEVDLAGDLDALPGSLQITVFRVCQEAMSNIRRHSGAMRAEVKVHRTDAEVWVEIRDNGTGFDVHAEPVRGFGLVGMRQRVRLAGGVFEAESAAGKGTTITARLPVRDEGN